MWAAAPFPTENVNLALLTFDLVCTRVSYARIARFGPISMAAARPPLKPFAAQPSQTLRRAWLDGKNFIVHSRGALGLLNRHLRNIRLIKQTPIHCHSRFTFVCRCPVRYAPASAAAVKFNLLGAPAVNLGCVRRT
jgi:hypothetical protein